MVTVLAVSFGSLQSVGAAPSSTFMLAGNMPPLLKRATLTSTTSPSQVLHLAISLNVSDTAALSAFTGSVDNPASPNYHKFLTPAEFTAQFSPSATQVQGLEDYLTSNGFTITNVAPNRLLIDATATVGQVESTFQTTINNYTLDAKLGSRAVYANATAPVLPVAYQGLVQNIAGLDDTVTYHRLGTSTAPKPAATKTSAFMSRLVHPFTLPSAGYLPSDIQTAYDINPLTSAGWNGQNQTIAFFEMDGFLQSDVNAYYSNLSVTQPTNTTVLVDSFSGSAGAGAGEVELDMEMAGAVASHANQLVYEAPNTMTGINDNYSKIINDNKAAIISSSWGGCETFSGNTELAALDTTFLQARAQGQSIFSASGDAGAYDCGDTNLAVDSPTSDPNVVSVGGTSLTKTGSTFSETAWSDPTDNFANVMGAGGGGGLSAYFSRPAYQSAPGVINTSSNGNREVPDVSAGADSRSGYAIYCTVTAALCASGGWNVLAGTSAAAPLWAASTAIMNQYISVNGKSYQQNRLGFLNPELYTLASTTQKYAPYHDVTSGNNLFYNAGTGYDLATGIGSPDIANITYDLASKFSVHDTFQRANQSHWGTPSNAASPYAWGGDAASSAAFSIASNVGQVSGGTTTYYAPVAYTNSDVQVFTTGSASSYSAPGGPNIGALIAYKDSSNWYKAYIDGSNLLIKRDVAGTQTTLSTTAFTAAANTQYDIRFQDIAGSLSAKVWAVSSSEPTSWTSTVSDSSFSPVLGNNQVGLSILDSGTAVVKIYDFSADGVYSATSTGSPSVATYIGQDNFTRANQSLWGTASDGSSWGSDASTNADFAISTNTGTVTGGTSQLYGVLGFAYANEEGLATFKVSGFSGGANAGVLLRYVDINHWYRAYIDGTSLVLQKNVAGRNTITSVPFAATGGTLYDLKFQIIGSELSAKVWATTAQEPLGWMVTAVNNQVTGNGNAGVSVVDATGVTTTYTLFQAEAITQASLGQDNFTRANQSHWGTASDANAWMDNASSSSNFAISSNAGTYSGATTQQYGELGSSAADAQAFATIKVSGFTGGANAGVMLRRVDANDWYDAYIDGTNLVIQRNVSGKSTLASVAFSATAGTLYNIRFQIIGSELSAKVWAASSAEPSAWMVTGVNTQVTASGTAGVAATDATGVTITYSAFSATTL